MSDAGLGPHPREPRRAARLVPLAARLEGHVDRRRAHVLPVHAVGLATSTASNAACDEALEVGHRRPSSRCTRRAARAPPGRACAAMGLGPVGAQRGDLHELRHGRAHARGDRHARAARARARALRRDALARVRRDQGEARAARPHGARGAARSIRSSRSRPSAEGSPIWARAVDIGAGVDAALEVLSQREGRRVTLPAFELHRASTVEEATTCSAASATTRCRSRGAPSCCSLLKLGFGALRATSSMCAASRS